MDDVFDKIFKVKTNYVLIGMLVLLLILINLFFIKPIKKIKLIKNQPILYYTDIKENKLNLKEIGEKRVKLDNKILDRLNKKSDLEKVKNEISNVDKEEKAIYKNIDEDATRILSKANEIRKEKGIIIIGIFVIIVYIIICVFFLKMKLKIDLKNN